MADAGDYECRLLADLLPTCVLVADFFASSDETTAMEARAGADAFTFYQNLNYEFCRLQAGQVVSYNGSLTVLGVGVIPLLEMLESRTSRPSLRPTWFCKSPFEGLESLRKVCGQNLSVEILRQRLRLSTASLKSRKRIIECLTNCNPECPLPLDSFTDEKGISGGKKLKSSLIKVSRLATRSHQLLCKNWACTCMPTGSHVAAKLLLTTYRSNKITNTMRFELLLSTSDNSYPWQETEIDVITNPSNIGQIDAAVSENEKGKCSPNDNMKVQGHKVRFMVEGCEPKDAKPKTKRWKVENICNHLHQTLGTRFRLLIEGNSIWRLRPARPKIKDLRKTIHISLSDLIQSGYFLQKISQKDKFLLTYIIASSILSLYQGPWLDQEWTKEQIFFLSQGGDLTTLDLSRPLLSTKCIATDHRKNQPHPDNIHPEPRIAALGIVMLEIALGMAIETRRDDGPLNSNTDLLNAYQLLDQMQHDRNAIPKHVLAIKTCLQPEDIFDEDLSNESKQHSLHTNIVGPLEAILTAYGIQTEDLSSELGGDQELSLSDTRSASETPNAKTRTMQFVSSANSSGTNFVDEISSIEPRDALDSVPAEQWFEDLETFVLPLVAAEPAHKIKIAILDSGIDLPIDVQYAYEDRLTYRSWIEGDNTNGMDICGHGTHAAGLLLKVTPHAEIFVARITENGEFNPNIVAKAIEYATDIWEVDIITMSFGFPGLEPTIDNALTHAAAKNTILIAAASNSGNRHPIAWPARAEQVICIHSLHGDGDHSSYTPNSRPQDYGILGQAVSSYWPPHFNAGISVLRSGTSGAAAIAAGVAALVLEYAQQKLPLYARPGCQVDEHVIRRLRSNAGMRMAFGLMAENRNGQSCIIPWSLLNNERNENTMCDNILERLRGM